MELRVPLVSSSDSVGKGRISALAVVETIAASGLSFWLAWKHKSVEHIVIASALAPFLLLRTNRSTKYTLDIVQRVATSFHPVVKIVAILFFLPVVKILAALKSFFTHPSEHILAIPQNFYKYVFTVDLLRSPQAIPEADQIGDLRQYDSLLAELKNLYDIPKLIMDVCADYNTIITKVLMMLFVTFVLIPVVVLSVSFRMAIKSTALL